MRKFKITVENTAYNVVVEEVDATAAVQAKPVVAATPAAPVATATPVAGGDTPLTCRLGGVVDSIEVTVGQHVNEGDKVMIVEAMKMKTSMVANKTGKVTSIAVKVADKVETGQVLMTIA
ncbi:Biotin-requiring enzyme [Formivibrio citricus]|uniref:Biotin-requiring enzyme n=1 Tax=Formivibrio citricus TaxID=83765 RepID=A0A1I5AYB3_9NEIS|nr:biotin/lipoyl-containing protein [Formivibrio citricus]SFN67434.1 Biotin-requiring enzyme [Formivibrio citricus]